MNKELKLILLHLCLIMICIILPLFAYYHHSRVTETTKRWHLTALPIIWYFINAPIHELSHLFATWVVGGKIIKAVIIPEFWLGHFDKAYIMSTGVTTSSQILITAIAPSLTDLMFLFSIIFFIPTKKGISFFRSFLYLLFIFRSSFDIFSNSLGGIILDQGDFHQIRQVLGWTGMIIISVILIVYAIYVNFRFFIREKEKRYLE